MGKLNIYFCIGLAASFLLAALTHITSSSTFRILLIIVLGQAHFFIAYLYYIDILRVRFANRSKKLLLLMLLLVGIVLLYYFSRYVWFTTLSPYIIFLTFSIFIFHHVENMFFLGEDFNQNFSRKKRTSLKIWTITYATSFFITFMTYAYYVLEKGHMDTAFSIWTFIILFVVLCVSAFKVYLKLDSYRFKLLLLLSIPLIFTAPFLLQKISFFEFTQMVASWHFFAWLILYGFILVLRKKEDFPTNIKELPSSVFSKAIRKTRKNVWNYIIFNIAVSMLILFLYILTAKIQGIAPLSSDMLYFGIFWGFNYFQVWVLAHILFTFIPKEVV